MAVFRHVGFAVCARVCAHAEGTTVWSLATETNRQWVLWRIADRLPGCRLTIRTPGRLTPPPVRRTDTNCATLVGDRFNAPTVGGPIIATVPTIVLRRQATVKVISSTTGTACTTRCDLAPHATHTTGTSSTTRTTGATGATGGIYATGTTETALIWVWRARGIFEALTHGCKARIRFIGERTAGHDERQR